MSRPRRAAANLANQLLFETHDDVHLTSDESEPDDGTASSESHSSADEEQANSSVHSVDVGHSGQMVSKNGQEVWNRNSVSSSGGQPRRHNVLREAKGPTRQAISGGESDAHAFKLFFTAEVVNKIVTFSNQEGHRRNAAWKDVDSEEIYVFIGVLILAGWCLQS